MIVLILILIILILALILSRCKYIEKDPNRFYVTSKGSALEWNGVMLKRFIELKYPDKEIVYTNISNPDLLVISIDNSWKDRMLHIDYGTPYISWSGEPQAVSGYNKGVYNLNSLLPKTKGDVWLPFMLVSHYQLHHDPYDILNRKGKPLHERSFLAAYISSNCTKNREELFRILSRKSDTVHARGKCSNNYKRVEGCWTSADKAYEEYIFGFALESQKKDGYLTEKILNVYRGGAIPIFWGDSKSAQKFFNEDTYIDLSDFDSLEEAADYIYALSKDKKKLQEIGQKNIFKDISYFTDMDKCFSLSL